MRETGTGRAISEKVETLLATLVSEALTDENVDDGDRDGVGEGTVGSIYTQKLNELAGYLYLTPNYLPRKIKSGKWDAGDLDKLADYFDMWPGDFVPSRPSPEVESE